MEHPKFRSSLQMACGFRNPLCLVHLGGQKNGCNATFEDFKFKQNTQRLENLVFCICVAKVGLQPLQMLSRALLVKALLQHDDRTNNMVECMKLKTIQPPTGLANTCYELLQKEAPTTMPLLTGAQGSRGTSGPTYRRGGGHR